jgi:spoIIIJ-associated protein
MDFFESEGKSVEEALQRICDEHGIPQHELDYEVMDQKKRILGLFGDETVFVKAWRKSRRHREPVEIIEKLCSLTGLECSATIHEESEGTTIINITGRDLGIIIGKNGEVLDAFQFLTRKIVNRGESEPQKIILDANGYRDRKIANLKRLALRSAKQVKATGQSLILDPMNAHDRRIIHLELKEDEEVFTKSLGEGNLKKIMIATKKSQDRPAKARDRL